MPPAARPAVKKSEKLGLLFPLFRLCTQFVAASQYCRAAPSKERRRIQSLFSGRASTREVADDLSVWVVLREDQAQCKVVGDGGEKWGGGEASPGLIGS